MRRNHSGLTQNCSFQSDNTTSMCVCVVEGVGKGVIGVVTLPVSGVIDFGSHAFESVHR